MGRFGLTSIADRIRSGARAHAVGRESPRNNSSVPPASSLSDDQPIALEAQNVGEKRSTDKRSRRNQNNNNSDVNNKSEKPQASPPLDRASSTSNSQAHGSGDPPSLDEPQPPDIIPKRSIPTRIREGCIRFWRHTKNAILRSYINILLVFVPIGIAAEFAHLRPEIVFAMNAIAIIPLAGLLTHATESVAVRLGDTLGALLNVSFGNAVELIIFIIALVKNEIRIVQASLLGSILANLLLILGMAFACGGLRYQEQIYNSTVTQMSACLLSLSVMSLLLPTAFHASFQDTNLANYQTLRISRGVSVVLLLVYILYLIFQLKSHSYLYQSMPQERIDEESHPGLLADVFDSSSSSDTSSSSSSDTDTTSGSHTTVKRIKRAFRNRKRRKSTTNSEDTRSVPSALPSPPPELNSPGSDGPYYKDRNGSFLGAITNGNEADHEGQTRNLSFVTKIRDFETSAEPSTMSPDRGSSPEGKYRRRMRKQRKHQKKHKKAAEKIKSLDKGIAEDAVEDAEPALRVDFAEPSTIPPGTSGSGTSKGKTGTHWRPGLPKLLSQNVFVDKPPVQQQPHPRLNRASSLPDLSRVSTVPGRGLRPSQLPPQPPPSKPRQILSSGEESEDEEEREAPQLSRTAAVVMLFVSTGLVALCAEFLVDAIPAMTESSNVSQTFIGLIILPIVGNAAEHVTAVTVAMKNKMDLSIGVAVGSSIQIALFVTPLVVILGWCISREMSLYFTIFETISLFVTAFVVNFLVLDGRSNYLEGTLLIASYIIIAVAAFFYPDSAAASEVGGGDTRNSTTNATTVAAHLMIRAFVA